MITLSFCSIAFPDVPIEVIVPRLAEIGYDAVEIWMNHVKQKSDAELMALRNLAEKHGIKPLVISPYFWLTQTEELLQESMKIAARAVHCAQVMGIPKIRTFTDAGPTGIGSDVATEAHWAVAVKALKSITSMDRNLDFVLEIHGKTLADTPQSALQVIERVGMPNLKILYHPMAGNTFEDYARLKPYVAHMHLQNTGIADGWGWVEEGAIDYPAFLRRLHGDGYRSSASVEYCWKPGNWDRAKSAYDHLAPHLK